MRLGRRRFLGIAAGAVAGGKKAVTAAANVILPEAISLAGLGTIGTVQPDGYEEGNGISGGDIDSHIAKLRKVSLLRRLPIPGFKKHDFRKWSKSLQYLDTDIATMRSWSLGQKKRAQTDRNYVDYLENYRNSPSREIKRYIYAKTHGTDPWDY
jgi:hypothetical protein